MSDKDNMEKREERTGTWILTKTLLAPRKAESGLDPRSTRANPEKAKNLPELAWLGTDTVSW